MMEWAVVMTVFRHSTVHMDQISK